MSDLRKRAEEALRSGEFWFSSANVDAMLAFRAEGVAEAYERAARAAETSLHESGIVTARYALAQEHAGTTVVTETVPDAPPVGAGTARPAAAVEAGHSTLEAKAREIAGVNWLPDGHTQTREEKLVLAGIRWAAEECARIAMKPGADHVAYEIRARFGLGASDAKSEATAGEESHDALRSTPAASSPPAHSPAERADNRPSFEEATTLVMERYDPMLQRLAAPPAEREALVERAKARGYTYPLTHDMADFALAETNALRAEVERLRALSGERGP